MAYRLRYSFVRVFVAPKDHACKRNMAYRRGFSPAVNQFAHTMTLLFAAFALLRLALGTCTLSGHPASANGPFVDPLPIEESTFDR
eukprot:2415058-Pyramimonas_sp.AAC.3